MEVPPQVTRMKNEPNEKLISALRTFFFNLYCELNAEDGALTEIINEALKRAERDYDFINLSEVRQLPFDFSASQKLITKEDIDQRAEELAGSRVKLKILLRDKALKNLQEERRP